MAINKVVAPNSVPTNVSDYVAQNAHMMGFMTQVNMQAFVLTDPTTADKPKVALGSYIAHGGSLYKVEGGDETISGSPADGKVYVRVTGSATLSASFVSDISAYTYNHAYGSMTSGGYTLLPYVIIKSGNSWLKYRFDAVHKLQAETINTGQGDFKVGQNLRPSDAVSFATVNAGRGATIVPKYEHFGQQVAESSITLPSMGTGEIRTFFYIASAFPNTFTVKLSGSSSNLFYVVGTVNDQDRVGIYQGGSNYGSAGTTFKGLVVRIA